ncbi:MAG: hypothetical protein E7009_03975 [Alphaproteobacteria bacterium]|nr:hypothetical protein [Alphaproteobacteria bacterium]
MKRAVIGILSVLALCACDKHDPILPGTRSPIFDTPRINILNTDIQNLPDVAYKSDNTDCPYTRDTSNVVWHNNRKIFSGFATDNAVASDIKPVCAGKYIYVGLTTGELVKIEPKSRKIMWIADIYRASNLTGGASMLDIVAEPIVREKYVYVGGLADAFCKINATSGARIWCTNISVPTDFTIAGDTAFVAGADKKLYALRLTDGAAYWTADIEKIATPIYENKTVTVGKQKFNAVNGK